MAISFGMLSTYPPTQCGLATFSQALATHMSGAGADVGVIRVVDSPQPAEALVTHQLVFAQRGATRRAAVALNSFDVAVVQHEYGIFGGRDGADVLAVLAGVRVPIISVLHTVLASPTPTQRGVLARVVAASSMVVTMTQTARQRLLDGWDVDPAKVVVIPHGALDNRALVARAIDEDRWEGDGGSPDGAVAAVDPRQAGATILTWGLLGRGKGIEWALPAIAGLADLDPSPVYRIFGQTHPRVLEREGEAYRQSLEAQVAELGIAGVVSFDSRYLDGPSLREVVRAADIVLLPYDSSDQVTSGVLTEAVVAGKPVISTGFPHAVELLTSGAGIIVAQHDSQAIGAALRRVLTEPGLAEHMAATARSLAGGLLWPAVAGEYVALGHEVLRSRRSVA